MAAYPTITFGNAPVVITTNNSSLSYSMLISTLTYVSYKVKRVYMEASSINQLNAEFQYNTVRPKGTKFSMFTSGRASPYQLLAVLDDLMGDDDNRVLDNMSTVSFPVEPLGYVRMYFYTDTYSLSDINSLGDTPTGDQQSPVQIEQVKKTNVLPAIISVLAIAAILIILLKDEKAKT